MFCHRFPHILNVPPNTDTTQPKSVGRALKRRPDANRFHDLALRRRCRHAGPTSISPPSRFARSLLDQRLAVLAVYIRVSYRYHIVVCLYIQRRATTRGEQGQCRDRTKAPSIQKSRTLPEPCTSARWTTHECSRARSRPRRMRSAAGDHGRARARGASNRGSAGEGRRAAVRSGSRRRSRPRRPARHQARSRARRARTFGRTLAKAVNSG
jgi:hypothetical protein